MNGVSGANRVPWRALTSGVLLVVVCVAGAAGGWLLVREPLREPVRLIAAGDWPAVASLGFAQALVALMAAVLLLCGSWLLTATLLSTAAALVDACRPAGGPTAAGTSKGAGHLVRALDRWSPRVVRRAVAIALGVAVTAGAAPAMAAPGTSGRLDGLGVPERVTGTGTVATAPATVPALAAHHDVVVAPGDSLWTIASRLLPSTATDTQVDRAWRLLYHANRATVGSDPDLIVPGARLRVPDLAGLTSSPTGRNGIERKEPQ